MVKTFGKLTLILWGLVFVPVMLNNRKQASGVVYSEPDNEAEYYSPSLLQGNHGATMNEGSDYDGQVLEYKNAMKEDRLQRLNPKVH